MQYKEPRLKGQFDYLLDPRFRGVLLAIDHRHQREYGEEIMATSLVRTVKENEHVGGRPGSSHLGIEGARGGDFSLKGWTEQMIDETVRWIKAVWGPMIHVRIHGKETKHMHININRSFAAAKEVR